jgi:hypothetical protein
MRALALLVGAAACAGCGLLDFDVAQPIPEQTVPGNAVAAAAGQLIGSGGAFPNPLTLNIDLSAQQKAHDTGPIDSVHMKSLSLTIEAASPTQNFDWLDEVHIFLDSTKSGTTLPHVEIATLAPVPKGQKTLSFKVNTSVNLKSYIEEGTKLSADATAHVPAMDVKFNGLLVVRVSPV